MYKSKNILITEGRVIDCTQNLDSTMDIFISNGKITKLEPKITDFPDLRPPKMSKKTCP